MKVFIVGVAHKGKITGLYSFKKKEDANKKFSELGDEYWGSPSYVGEDFSLKLEHAEVK